MLSEEIFIINGKVEIFPQQGGWYYVGLPKKYTEIFKNQADRGLVAVKITLGDTTWDSSIMPKGDGTLFIALSKKVRQAEGVKLGDQIKLEFVLRER